MRHLGIEMIVADSPEARGRCERRFPTLPGRVPRGLAARGITAMPGLLNRVSDCATLANPPATLPLEPIPTMH